jgi:hypothetical protein
MRSTVRWLLLVLVALVFGGSATVPGYAHSGSYDMKYVDGANVLLLTFNTHTPVSGLDIEHNLRLYDQLGAPVPYDEVAVEVHTQDRNQSTTLRGSTLISEQLAPMLPTNESKLSVTYPVAGAYSLLVEFRAGGRAISTGRFAVDVGQGTSTPGGFPWLRLGLTLLLGIAVGAMLPRRASGTAEPVAVEQAPEPVEAPA